MRKALRGAGRLRRGFSLASALAALLLAGLAPSALAYDAYVANLDSSSVSVIDTQTNRVVGSPISVGSGPIAIAITPDGKIASPGIRIRCPASAKPGGCKFKLQAVTKKRKGRAESAVARVKVKAGRSALVSLIPKPAFSATLATAKTVLVKETVTINGSKRTLFRRLKVVR